MKQLLFIALAAALFSLLLAYLVFADVCIDDTCFDPSGSPYPAPTEAAANSLYTLYLPLVTRGK